MPTPHTSTWLVALLLTSAAASAVAGNETRDDGKTAKDTATSVVNEIGKGIESVGKAVGPAINKAEKAVRGAVKGEDDKRGTDRK